MTPISPLEIAMGSSILRCTLNPWDTTIFGFPVAQVEYRDGVGDETSAASLAPMLRWFSDNHIRIASCRLPCGKLRESMLLEDAGFRFVEVVLHPCVEHLQQHSIEAGGLQVVDADARMLGEIATIAESAFGNERYHTDPRLDHALAGLRYGQWVRNSAGTAHTKVLGLLDDARLVAFFVCRGVDAEQVEWVLTAVAPQWQRQGYGLRAWRRMLDWHKSRGVDAISTTIAARNVPVLNLYSKLGFRFRPPDMTFHWIADYR
jgi:RimJ/RimL family protein N-acetyltransferase